MIGQGCLRPLPRQRLRLRFSAPAATLARPAARTSSATRPRARCSISAKRAARPNSKKPIETVSAFLAARAKEDWAGTCAQLSQLLLDKLEHLATNSTDLEDTSCPSFLEAFVVLSPQERRKARRSRAAACATREQRAISSTTGRGRRLRDAAGPGRRRVEDRGDLPPAAELSGQAIRSNTIAGGDQGRDTAVRGSHCCSARRCSACCLRRLRFGFEQLDRGDHQR